jgi:hypothetical protein
MDGYRWMDIDGWISMDGWMDIDGWISMDGWMVIDGRIEIMKNCQKV